MNRIRKPDPRDGVYRITPAVAASLIANGAKNRPLRQARAQRVADAIIAGDWRTNGETIVFDEKGRLTDGQHRLRGCVLADRDIEVYCVFGIPSKYFASFDQGASRGGDDIAAIMEFQHASLVAACARLAIKYSDGTLASGVTEKVPAEALRLYMQRRRDALMVSAGATSRLAAGLKKLVPLSHVTFLYYMTFEPCPEKAMEFVDKLSTGTGLKKGDAILLFRDRMNGMVGEKHILRTSHRIALLIKTWNAFLDNKPIHLLRWKSDSEVFPTVDVSS